MGGEALAATMDPREDRVAGAPESLSGFGGGQASKVHEDDRQPLVARQMGKCAGDGFLVETGKSLLEHTGRRSLRPRRPRKVRPL